MKELNKLVTLWHKERNTIEGSTVQAQLLKLTEEALETYEALRSSIAEEYKKEYHEAVIDGAGDCLVVINCLCNQLDLDMDTILTKATLVDYSDTDEESNEKHWTGLLNGLNSLIKESMRKARVDVMEKAIIQMIQGIQCYLEAVEPTYFAHKDRLHVAYLHAYNEIKDRKGMMVNGVFVKEADL